MDEFGEKDYRPALLCKRLGNLKTEVDAPPRESVISTEILDECKRTIFGKLYSGGDINYQGFISTMTRAWKVDSLNFAQRESDILSFTFESERDKNRILANSPWSFSSNLLILKPWEPNKLAQCYKFTSCEFWVQVHGLPIEWCSEEIVSLVAQQLGGVKEVKVEKRGVAFHKVGKARVDLELEKPLKPGTLFNLGEEKVWLDFKYERLPRFYYSCGRVGHFTTNCKEIPYDVAKIEDRKNNMLGNWLKAEVKGNSPFWELFYDEKVADQEVEPQDDSVISSHDTQIVIFTGEQTEANNSELSQSQSRAQMDVILLDIQLEQQKEKGKGIVYAAEPKTLQDTPISLSEDTRGRALVASPNKPPVHK
ncbi:uncharacterized protein LOC120288488 [Eucalyptus grandis]|uniref:uncharacterized protein LOC120288488 n=1 Tax=Eucalyptus grandis TaxID=71139 RepID=UPI00192EC180|nr:uncharacterized protein LOC120288488 [Eucalyptus grandis]